MVTHSSVTPHCSPLAFACRHTLRFIFVFITLLPIPFFDLFSW